MEKILVVIDMQNFFITGQLGTAEAQAIVPAVAAKIKAWEGPVYVTRDINPFCDEGSEGFAVYQPVQDALPPYAVYFNKRTFGCVELAEYVRGHHGGVAAADSSANQPVASSADSATKSTANSVVTPPAGRSAETSADQPTTSDAGPDLAIEFCGVCTNVCVISNALMMKAFLPKAKITVDASCCAGFTPEIHQSALDVMRSCRIEVSNG